MNFEPNRSTAANLSLVSARRLSDRKVDTSVKLGIVNELRESIEIVQSPEYPRYLATLLPVFIQLLSTINPVFNSDAEEHVSLVWVD